MSKETEFQNKVRDIVPEDSDAVGNLITEIYGESPIVKYFNSLTKAEQQEYLKHPQFNPDSYK